MFATKTNATGSNATKNPNHVKKERAESLHVWLGGLHAPLVRGQPTHRPQSLSFHRSQTEVSTAPGHRFSPKRFSIRRPGSERLVPALRRLPEPSLSFPSSLQSPTPAHLRAVPSAPSGRRFPAAQPHQDPGSGSGDATGGPSTAGSAPAWAPGRA